MTNITIEAPLVDGGLTPYIEHGETCKTAVEFVTGDDQRPPPRSLNIKIQTASGKMAVIVIPNDSDGVARILIDGQVV